MKTLLLSLGSNIGDRKDYLKRAITALFSSNQLQNIKLSSIYETEPVGFVAQSKFLNLALLAETALKPFELLSLCQQIEFDLGRIKRERWHEREIDIDIIFFDNEKIIQDDLIIPHPRMHKRKFVLIPVNELAPGFVHPGLNFRIDELLERCTDESQVLFFDKLEL